MRVLPLLTGTFAALALTAVPAAASVEREVPCPSDGHLYRCSEVGRYAEREYCIYVGERNIQFGDADKWWCSPYLHEPGYTLTLGYRR